MISPIKIGFIGSINERVKEKARIGIIVKLEIRAIMMYLLFFIPCFKPSNEMLKNKKNNIEIIE